MMTAPGSAVTTTILATLFVLAGLLPPAASPGLRPALVGGGDRSQRELQMGSSVIIHPEEGNDDGRIPAWLDYTDGQVKVRGRSLSSVSKGGEPDIIGQFIPSHLGRDGSASCSDCYGGFLFPSLTYPDGSDRFKSDYWSPSWENVNVTDSNPANVSDGCYYAESPVGFLICDDDDVTDVPQNLPPVLSVFKMNRTAVTVLRSNSFKGLRVQILNLEYNPSLSSIQKNAFRGVTGLQSLSLEYNALSSIHAGSFNGLDSLLILSFRGNLIDLSDVGTEEPAQNQTQPLPSLVYLNLADNPLGSLNKFIFWGLRNSSLEELNLQSCNLRYIHPDAFEPLTSLVHVDLFNNPRLASSVFISDSFVRLPPSLRQLGLANNKLFEHIPPAILNDSSLPNVEIINLSGNVFFSLVSSQFPESSLSGLKYLIMEGCSISSIREGTFKNLPNLTQLYLGANQLTEIGSGIFPPSLTLLSIRQNPQRMSSAGQQQRFKLSKGSLSELPNLLWLDMNYMGLESLSADDLAGLHKLLILQLRRSSIHEIAGPIFSQLTNLTVLDLGENEGLTSLPADFSLGLDNLYILFLDHCSINFPSSSNDSSSTGPFSHFGGLRLLYINNNKISSLEPYVTANLTQLELLYMSDNFLTTWHRGTTAKFPPYTTAVVASKNLMNYLPNQTFEEFAQLYAIDLSYNAFACNCQTVDLRRLAEGNTTDGTQTNVTVLKWNSTDAYFCTDFSTEEPVHREIRSLTEEEFKCETREAVTERPSDPGGNNTTPSIVGGTIAGSILLILVTGGAVYYKRANVQRAWFHLRHRKECRAAAASIGEDFEYDAFISFNEQDRPWVYSHLVPNLEVEHSKASALLDPEDQRPSFRLCLHDRDFTVGQRITENIIESIAKSRKVVIVLSKSYVESKWCQFELHLSQHRLMEADRPSDALVLVLLEEVPKGQQDSLLRYLIRTRTYLAWRSDLEGQRHFWRRMRQVLSSRDALTSTAKVHLK